MILLKKIKRKIINPKKFVEYKKTDVIAYRCIANELERCKSSNLDKTIVPKKLPNELFISKGIYSIEDKLFNLQKEGLYRFYALDRINEQRIIPPKEIVKVLGTISWLWSYGNIDESLDINKLLSIALNKKLCLGCSKLSFFCCSILTKLGYSSRVVACYSADEWDNFDDGHTLIEVCDESGKWILYDPSFKCVFKKNNKLLSLLELLHCIRTGTEYQIQTFGGGEKLGVFKSNNYDYNFWIEERMFSEKKLVEWYNHILWIPLIYESNKFYFTGNNEIKEKIINLSNSFIHMNIRDFIDKFYLNYPIELSKLNYLYD
jgi:hypothetical protein